MNRSEMKFLIHNLKFLTKRKTQFEMNRTFTQMSRHHVRKFIYSERSSEMSTNNALFRKKFKPLSCILTRDFSFNKSESVGNQTTLKFFPHNKNRHTDGHTRNFHSLNNNMNISNGTARLRTNSRELPIIYQSMRHIAKRNRGGQHSHTPIINPIEDLQQHVVTPIINENDIVFKPTMEEINEAQKLFLPGPKHKIEFVKSALFTEHLPDYNLPEVAFIGRSNVGKSSLIKILLSGVPDLSVRVSQKPGHTKLLNFFRVGQKFSVVDMPGYGYRMPDHYVESVENFLFTRPKLCRTLFLVDGTVGITETDVIGLNMIEGFRIPYIIVMTKIDKTRPSKLLENFLSVLKYRDQTKFCFQQPFLISSATGDGVALLQTFIAYVTGNFAVEGT